MLCHYYVIKRHLFVRSNLLKPSYLKDLHLFALLYLPLLYILFKLYVFKKPKIMIPGYERNG
jgi:hypothetical protein